MRGVSRVSVAQPILRQLKHARYKSADGVECNALVVESVRNGTTFTFAEAVNLLSTSMQSRCSERFLSAGHFCKYRPLVSDFEMFEQLFLLVVVRSLRCLI